MDFKKADRNFFQNSRYRREPEQSVYEEYYAGEPFGSCLEHYEEFQALTAQQGEAADAWMIERDCLFTAIYKSVEGTSRVELQYSVLPQIRPIRGESGVAQ